MQQVLGQILPGAGERGRGKADGSCWKEHLPDPGDLMPGVPSGVSGLNSGDFSPWKALPEPDEKSRELTLDFSSPLAGEITSTV